MSQLGWKQCFSDIISISELVPEVLCCWMAPVVILTPATAITSPDLHTHDLHTFLQDSYLVLYFLPYCKMFLFLQYLSSQEMSQKA